MATTEKLTTVAQRYGIRIYCGDRYVGFIPTIDLTQREADEYARLFVAATYLLEACIAMRDHYGQDEFMKACDLMEAAIRKATT